MARSLALGDVENVEITAFQVHHRQQLEERENSPVISVKISATRSVLRRERRAQQRG